MLDLLDAIAARLSQDPDALALLALGSVGRDQQRMDEHSDLDFFVIASSKYKFLDDLSWLGDVAWSHRDTPDGAKALVEGVYCEFAVFLPQELKPILYQAGRVVWSRPGLEIDAEHLPDRAEQDWLVNEVLSNVYVGMHRWLRGEKLSAMRFVQGQALDNLLRILGNDDPFTDPFTPTRRAERLGLDLDEFAGGYRQTPGAAAAILRALPPGGGAMRAEVAALIQASDELVN
jgi:hypothetical protein